MSWTFKIGETFVEAYIRPFTSLKVTHRGFQGVGTLQARLLEEAPFTLDLQNESEVTLVDQGVKEFGGYLRKRIRKDLNTTNVRVWTIECQDYNTDPADDWVPVGAGPREVEETDQARVRWLFDTYGTRGINAWYADAVQVVAPSNLLPMDFQGKTLAEALDAICALSGASWYIDYEKRLHYFKKELAVAPFNIDVQSPNGTTTRPCRDFEYPDDTISYVNTVAVVGLGVTSTVYRDGVVPDPGQQRLFVLNDQTLLTVDACIAAGEAYLTAEERKEDGKFTVWSPGLQPGQTIHIKNTQWAMDGDFRIMQVTPRFVDLDTAFYDVQFGGRNVTLSDLWTKTTRDITRTQQQVADANYYATTLAGKIPVVEVLPELPDDDYPQATLVFLTVDQKLYRNGDGSTWTAAVDAADILVNKITTGQIEAGAIGASELASEIILATNKFIAGTGGAGRRVEIDVEGVRNYAADEELLVNIPTVGGDPVKVAGEIQASSLISKVVAELQGSVKFAGSSVAVLEVGVTNPIAAPLLVPSTDYQTLASAPLQPGSAICYDPSGSAAGGVATFWIAANPTIGNLLDVAYEYRKSDGVLLRTLRKAGTTTTGTRTFGSTSHVGESAQASAASDRSQIATQLTMPEDGTITKVSIYLGGYNGDTPSVRNCVWTNGGSLLGYSAGYTVAARSFSNGNALQYNKPIAYPFFVGGGTSLKVGAMLVNDSEGWWWDRDDGSGKTQYLGSGNDFDPFAVTNTDTAHKPNVFVTYTYEIDSSVEGTMGKIVGVARAPVNAIDYIWVLDSNGMLFKYLQSSLVYQAKYNLASAIPGSKANAGLFYDATAGQLIITTVTGTTGTDQVKLIKVTPSTGEVAGTVSTTGNIVNGAAAVVRGGCLVNDLLNSSTPEYWIPINGVVYAYVAASGVNVPDRSFGQSTESTGIVYDGVNFRGWSASNPSRVYRYSDWDWTTTSSVYWVGYAWYDGHTSEKAGSATASTNLITSTNHGLVAGDRVRFGNLVGGSGLNTTTDYVVLADGLTANEFKVALP